MTGQTTSKTFTGQDKFKHSAVNSNAYSEPNLTLVDDILEEVNDAGFQTKNGHSSLQDLRAKFIVDLSAEPKPQPVALEVIGQRQSAPIAIYGAITLVTAKAKAGKTYAHSILVSALIKGSELFGRIRPHFITGVPNRRKVAVFLTEESHYDSHRVGRRILKLTGLREISPLLDIWRLRTEPNNIKKQIIQQVLYSDPDICAVVIDGGRDTVFDINSSEESCNAWTDLVKWADELGIAIIVILHQNKDNTNARGHYGSEGKNKSEIIVNVTKDREAGTFTIEVEDSRSIEFEPIVFKIDQDGIPYITDDFIPQDNSEGRKKALLPHQLPKEQHIKILVAIQAKTNRPRYEELCTQIQLQFQTYGIVFGSNKAIEFCTYYKNQGWFEKNETKVKGERSATYSVRLPL